MQYTLRSLLSTANILVLSHLNDSDYDQSIQGLNTLEAAKSSDLCFFASTKYQAQLLSTQARFVLMTEKHALLPRASTIVPVIVKDPYLAFANLSILFEQRDPITDIHPTAIIASSARISDGVVIGANVVIGERVVIEEGAIIQAGVHLEHDVHISARTYIDFHVVIHHHCRIGSDCRIHSGAVIGADGFGFAPKMSAEGMQWQRIAQLGKVVVGNHCRVGANTTIDRGALQDTEIGHHVILDNLIQIGHGVKVGDGTAIAAHTAIAGSTQIGKNCIIGGCVAITGHIEIVDGVTITGATVITKSIMEAGSYSSGVSFSKTEDWRKAAVIMRRLPDLQIEKRLARLESKLNLEDYE